MIHLAAHRRTPIDAIMRDLEREYRAGRIGITQDGEITPLSDIYEDMTADQPADYNIASTRMMDRETQKVCRHCGTAYRTTDQRDETRCPFCWRLV